ncbi:hypothetical protein CWE09_01660 [Aliidiomarina minuta]|uniref:Leucine-binding protein domain-containing protein n=1 Tax=Aliidiomarina minuta TaxID=880057 RepID=A0A432W662_9GAMM|nr:amino acid ABC transporter substrate-binding protein [Aliidiomarina minuta]RUO25469.1 hypothetical protein CWE09_01660 [Aliidiomarina minuta]
MSVSACTRIATLVGVALTTIACSQSNDPIRIGATMSQSGAYSTQGSAAANGYLLCQEHINRDGGLLGRDIEFIIHDDESDSERAVALYQQLIVDEQVDAIMGPYGSTLTEAIAPVTEQHRMVQISPLAATSSIWEQDREYLFMVLPPAELFLAGLIEMAAEQGYERVAVVAEDALFPKAAAEGAAQLAREKGMQVLTHYTYGSDYGNGGPDFSSLIQEFERTGVEVLAMAASSLNHFIDMAEQLQEQKVNLRMFGTSGAVDEFQQELGATAEYVFGLSAWEASLPNPGNEEFVAAYQERFDREPSFHAAGGYGSCQLFAEAVEKAGSLDQDAIRDELLALESSTVFSQYAVDERGYQTANQGVFIQWQDGEKVVVWPADVAIAEPRIPMPAWDQR